MEHTFTCAACGGTFPKGWSDEEAKSEAKALWGDVPAEECVVICDDCFQSGKDEALARHEAAGKPRTAADYDDFVRAQRSDRDR